MGFVTFDKINDRNEIYLRLSELVAIVNEGACTLKQSIEGMTCRNLDKNFSMRWGKDSAISEAY